MTNLGQCCRNIARRQTVRTVQWFCCCSKVGTSPPMGICLASSSSFTQIHLHSSSRRPRRRDQRSALASRWALQTCTIQFNWCTITLWQQHSLSLLLSNCKQQELLYWSISVYLCFYMHAFWAEFCSLCCCGFCFFYFVRENFALWPNVYNSRLYRLISCSMEICVFISCMFISRSSTALLNTLSCPSYAYICSSMIAVTLASSEC